MVETLIKPNLITKIKRSLQAIGWMLLGVLFVLLAINQYKEAWWWIIVGLIGVVFIILGPISIIDAWKTIIIFQDGHFSFKVNGEFVAFKPGELQKIKLVYNTRGKITTSGAQVNFENDARFLETLRGYNSVKRIQT